MSEQSIRDELAKALHEIHDEENPGWRDDADMLLASPVIRHIQAEAMREALNELPAPDDDARSGMIHARGLIAELIARKSS